MRYLIVIIILFVFSVPISFANGGPEFKDLHKATHQDKPVVELIDASTKKVEKKICLINVGQNIVEEKPC